MLLDSEPHRSTARVIPFVARPDFTFGIYHGGVVESHRELSTGKPDCPEQVNQALNQLQSGRHLLVRTYIRFNGSADDSDLEAMPSIADLARYTWNGRKLDLVVSNWDGTGNMQRWGSFVERVVERFGEYTQNFQICEEPNLFEYPGDGRFSHSVDAVVTGIQAARYAMRCRRLNALVGFNAVPTSVMNDAFWRDLRPKMDKKFLNSLDYIGLNMYLDVSEPIIGNIEDAVESTLTHFRQVSLAEAGIPASVPIHVSECGWPTGPNRFYTRQAELLERVVRKVCSLRHILNLTQFELFSLRDADTANPDAARQFGIMRDDYTPKPAFETYRQLIQEFGS